MYCSIARLTIFLLLICIVERKCTSWVQPQIGVYSGFLNIYSTGEDSANSGDLIAGQPYTLDIRMSDTDRYDYLLQFCTYNDKYHFVDQNSCLVCDNFFKQMWENDMYQLQGVAKRTIIHFKPPEPLARIECSVRILQCCGCAERACERNILQKLVTYPQQVINLAIVNEQTVGISAASVVSWPWWIWLLILLALVLLLCLLPLFLLLYSQLCMHKRKISDSKSQILRPTPAKVSNILVRAKEMETNGAHNENLRRPSVLPSLSTRIFRTSSDSPSESAHSTASKSRAAVVIKQQQPYTFWAERLIQSEIESKPTLDRYMGRSYLIKVIEECKNVAEYQDDAGLTSEFRSSTDECHINRIGSEKAAHRVISKFSRIMHQQTICEEKFLKKKDCQKGMFEEGYDRFQLTYIVPAKHFFHSEVV
ncbi:Spike glycoprotein [Dirofilaria immitis]